MNYHRRMRKQKHWAIDYVREMASVTGVLPIRSSEDLRKMAAQRMGTISDWIVDDFKEGNMSYPCLFGFKENPMHLRAFTLVEEELGIDRLDRQLEVRN